MVSRGRPSLRDFVPYNSPARPRALLHCNDEVLPVNALIGWPEPEDPKLHPRRDPLRETPQAQALRVRTLVMLC